MTSMETVESFRHLSVPSEQPQRPQCGMSTSWVKQVDYANGGINAFVTKSLAGLDDTIWWAFQKRFFGRPFHYSR